MQLLPPLPARNCRCHRAHPFKQTNKHAAISARPSFPLTASLQSYSFNYMGQKLGLRVRLVMFQALMRQVSQPLPDCQASTAAGASQPASQLPTCAVRCAASAWPWPAKSGSLLPARFVSVACLLQEVGWYDEDRNNSGVLTSKLSADALAVKGQFGDTMGLLTQVGGEAFSHALLFGALLLLPSHVAISP